MRFGKRRSHEDREDRADVAHMMGPGGMMFGMGFMHGGRHGIGRGGPFGRHGGPGGDFGDEGRGGRHGGGGFGGDGFGRGRGRGARMFGQGELRLLLLSLLAGENRHGYDLIKAVEDLTGGAYAPSPGVVYPTLSLLVDEGLIAEAPGAEIPGGGARKAFAATDAGRAEAEARAQDIATIVARLKALADATSREASPPVMRAMANLKLALRGRVFATGFDESVAHQIADVLDEAARRIERL